MAILQPEVSSTIGELLQSCDEGGLPVNVGFSDVSGLIMGLNHKENPFFEGPWVAVAGTSQSSGKFCLAAAL